MGQRQAQEFWDKMWYWEEYELFPGEASDDPHLVIMLGAQVDRDTNMGTTPDPDVFRRFDACVGRMINRFELYLPRQGEAVDVGEFSDWLRFGLDPTHRGHDGVPNPIIDANSLFIFLRFARYAREYCERHQLPELAAQWSSIEGAAQEIEDGHSAGGGGAPSSRFEAPVG